MTWPRSQTSLAAALQAVFGFVQAQPSFADTNLVGDLSESSGPVEQLKSKFFGPQVLASVFVPTGCQGSIL